VAGSRSPYRVSLVAVKPKPVTDAVGLGLIARTEDPRTLAVQEPLIDEIIDVPAALERRVQLERAVRPQQPLVGLAFDMSPDTVLLDAEEGLRIVAVVLHKLVSNGEDVHGEARKIDPCGRWRSS
jgi:hypothetical protein